jgi:hypothetical protein
VLAARDLESGVADPEAEIDAIPPRTESMGLRATRTTELAVAEEDLSIVDAKLDVLARRADVAPPRRQEAQGSGKRCEPQRREKARGVAARAEEHPDRGGREGGRREASPEEPAVAHVAHDAKRARHSANVGRAPRACNPRFDKCRVINEEAAGCSSSSSPSTRPPRRHRMRLISHRSRVTYLAIDLPS